YLICSTSKLEFMINCMCSPYVAGEDDSPAGVSQIVSANKGECFPLKKPAGVTLRKAGLEDTVYKDNFLVVNGWGKFYLPKVVTMQVITVVEGISFPCEQLVLMTCEDQQVYAYDEEELHLVASSMKQLRDEGMEYPGSTVYYRGEAFKDMVRSYICLLDLFVNKDDHIILEYLKHSRKQKLESF
uniref:Uncharacterized protein n=1 Tax=Oreochromis aureus TaxID=47969 RepID=A0AAZ1X9N6_OREAU